MLKSLTLSLVAGAPKKPAITSHENNAISTAFDDLLGLSAPSDSMSAALPSGAIDILGMSAPTQPPKVPKWKGAWLRASIKVSRAEGSPVVDWSKVSLHYRVHSMPDRSAMVIAFREACVHRHTSQDKTSVVLLSPHQRSGREHIPVHGHVGGTINQRIQSVRSGKDQGFDGKSGSQV